MKGHYMCQVLESFPLAEEVGSPPGCDFFSEEGQQWLRMQAVRAGWLHQELPYVAPLYWQWVLSSFWAQAWLQKEVWTLGGGGLGQPQPWTTRFQLSLVHSLLSSAKHCFDDGSRVSPWASLLPGRLDAEGPVLRQWSWPPLQHRGSPAWLRGALVRPTQLPAAAVPSRGLASQVALLVSAPAESQSICKRPSPSPLRAPMSSASLAASLPSSSLLEPSR